MDNGVIAWPRPRPANDRLLPLASYGDVARELPDTPESRRPRDGDFKEPYSSVLWLGMPPRASCWS